MKILIKFFKILLLLVGLCAGQVSSQDYLENLLTKIDEFNNTLEFTVKKLSNNASTVIKSVTGGKTINEKKVTHAEYCGPKDNPKKDKTNSNIVSTSEMSMPIKSYYKVSSDYGYRKDPFTHKTMFHNGIDLAAPRGANVYTIGNGTILEIGYSMTYGRYIIVDHSNRTRSKYAHLKSINVNKGDVVYKGDIIGKVGSSGRSTGPHLHFELIINNKRVNPNNKYRF